MRADLDEGRNFESMEWHLHEVCCIFPSSASSNSSRTAPSGFLPMKRRSSGRRYPVPVRRARLPLLIRVEESVRVCTVKVEADLVACQSVTRHNRRLPHGHPPRVYVPPLRSRLPSTCDTHV